VCFQQVIAVGPAVSPADHHMGVDAPFTVLEADVPDERERDDVAKALAVDPNAVRVELTQKARGGITITATAAD
jgi:hypothetical protein